MSRRHLSLPLILLAACGPFEGDPTGPGGPPPPTGSDVAVPFRIGATNAEEFRTIAAVQGGVVVAGWYGGTLDFDPRTTATGRTSLGGQDIAIARYDNDGALQWVTSLGGSGADVPHAMATTPDGGVVVVGYGSGGGLCGGSVLAGAGGRDALIAKLGPTGSCEWAVLVGGSADDEARAVAVDTDGSIVVAGLFRGTADFAPGGAAALLPSRGGSDGFLARYSNSGELIAVEQGGGLDDDLFAAVHLAASGDVTVAGEMRGTASFGSPLAPAVLVSAGGADIVVARYTGLLGLRWAFRAGGPAEDRATALTADFAGAPIVAGTFEGTADLDPSPGTAILVSRGAADAFFARYHPETGAWDGLARGFGGTGSEGVSAVLSHSSGRVVLSGWFQESVDFDPGAGARVVIAKATGGGADLFTAAYGASGEFEWVTPVGASVGGAGQQAIAFGLAEDSEGQLWSTGRFFGRADFDPGTEAVELLALGDADAFVARYGATTGALLTVDLPE